jgi:hypothetical protein
MRRLPVAVRRIALMAVANVVSLGIASQAAADVVTNFGGPILGAAGHPWTIAPLYVGSNWGSATSTAVLDHQRFLTNLADYVSGTYLPPTGMGTFLKQYGVVAKVTVAAPIVDTTQTARPICDSDIKTFITTNQGNANHLAAYGPDTLIMVFPSTGFTSNCSATATFAYHSAVGANAYYGVSFADSATVGAGAPFTVVTAHEIFEAATDPYVGVTPNSPAWANPSTGEICDGAGWPTFGFNGVQILGCWDNSLGGAVSTTGYDPPTPFDPVSFLYSGLYPTLL